MKLITFLISTIILLLFTNLKAQNLGSIPKGLAKEIKVPLSQTPSVPEVYEAFMKMDPYIDDTIRNHEYIKASRWMSRVFSKYNIEDSVT